MNNSEVPPILFLDPAPLWEQKVFIAVAVIYGCLATFMSVMYVLRGHTKIVGVRMPIVMVPGIMYGAFIVAVTSASYIVGKTPVMCGFLSYSYVIFQGMFSAPDALSYPTVVLASELNKLKVEYNQGARHRYWSLQHLLKPMVRAYIVIGVTIVVTVTYAATKYSGVVLPGGEHGRSPHGEEEDCFRLGLIFNTAYGLVFMGLMGAFSLRVIKVADPYFIKYELIFLTCMLGPILTMGMVYAVAPQIFPVTFDIRFFFIIVCTIAFTFAIVTPVLLSYRPIEDFALKIERRTKRLITGGGQSYQDLELEENSKAGLVTAPADLFLSVLDNAVLLKAFTDFLVINWCVENILFYKEVEALQDGFATMKYEERKEKANKILEEFVNLGAPLEINLEHGTRGAIIRAIKEDAVTVTTFKAAQRHIFELMKKDSFEKWQKLPDFKKALKEAGKRRGAGSRSHDRFSQSQSQNMSRAQSQSQSQTFAGNQSSELGDVSESFSDPL